MSRRCVAGTQGSLVPRIAAPIDRLFPGVVFLWMVGSLTAPLGAFTPNPDGTLTDPATGLMWDRCSWGQTWDGADACTVSATTHTWQAALEIAVTANAANHRGYNDWRLPNLTEIESLVATEAFEPAINATAFPSTPSAGFWSSTLDTPNPSNAWNAPRPVPLPGAGWGNVLALPYLRNRKLASTRRRLIARIAN